MLDHGQHLIQHRGSIVDEGKWLGTRRQAAVCAIGAVGKDFVYKAKTGGCSGLTGQAATKTIYY